MPHAARQPRSWLIFDVDLAKSSKMHRVILIAVLLSAAACSSIPARSGAWQPRDFVRASDPEVASIAATILKQLFSKPPPSDHLYYLSVVDADWQDVVRRTGIPALASFMYGYRDHMITRDGIRDRSTGLRVYTIHIEIDGQIANSGPVEVAYVHSYGTGLGTAASKFTLEKRNGEWVVIGRKSTWSS